MIIRPVVINPAPSFVSMALGGLVGSLIALSIMYAAPAAALPTLDALGATGAPFSENRDVALAVGALLLLAAAVLILPGIAGALWTMLPGSGATISGRAVKGLAIGALHWLIAGFWMGLAGLAAGNETLPSPGFMGMGAGAAGAAVFTVASVAYGQAVVFVSFVEQGISPLDALGWTGYTQAAAGPIDLGAHRSGEPEAARGGERPWRAR